MNTRERLVSERHREHQWLEDQLALSDSITTTYQGVRDLREFVGFYNELAIAFDPSLGLAEHQRLERQGLEHETELWRQRTELLEAKRGYQSARNKKGNGKPDPDSDDKPDGDDATDDDATDDGAAKDDTAAANTKTEEGQTINAAGNGDTPQPSQPAPAPTGGTAPTLPATSSPFGTTPNDIKLPQPKDVEFTQAQGHPIDLFHDKLAYRDAVNAAIKSAQLDDSHDFAGQMLYELTLSVALTPGIRSRQYAQVELEIVPQKLDADRARQLFGLYDNWVNAVVANIASDIASRQSRIMELPSAPDTPTEHRKARPLDEGDREFLLWFINDVGPTLAVQLHNIETADDNGDAQFFSVPKLYSLKMNLNSGRSTHAQRIEECLSALADIATQEQLKQPPVNKLADLRRAVGWAVWGSYFLRLDTMFGTSPPTFDNSTGRLTANGLRLEKQNPSYNANYWKDYSNAKDALLSAYASTGISNDKIGTDKDTGAFAFVRRVSALEQSPHALTISPKEHAQNISEATARESMLNLILALSAALPSSGVNAQNQSQFVNRAQTYLHAITRQPLLVGYGNGDRRFGWFLGPAFNVDKGEADFKHRVIRHDVSAGIVVPAWQNLVKLTGTQYWIDHDGKSIDGGPLWKDKEQKDGENDKSGSITLNMPIPVDASKHITRALLANEIAAEPYLYASRPRPRITSPRDSDLLDIQSVRPGETGVLKQQVLVLGENLWRNPQVFIGSQKADRVEVLSNMEGVLAEFDRVVFPGPMDGIHTGRTYTTNLTVISSFGEDRREGIIRVLWPATLPQPATKPAPLMLVRPFRDSTTPLAFRLEQPSSYGKVQLAIKPAANPDYDWTPTSYSFKWIDNGKLLVFDVPDRTPPTSSPAVYLTQVRIQPRSDTTAGVVHFGGDDVAFAWFNASTERALTADPAAVKFDVDGSANTAITFALPTPQSEDVFKVAYPGLFDAIKAGKAIARLTHTNDHVDLPLTALTKDGVAELTTQGMTSNGAPLKLLPKGTTSKAWTIAVVYPTAGGEVTVPVMKDSKNAEVSFTRDTLPTAAFKAIKPLSAVKFEPAPSIKFTEVVEFVLRLDQDPKQFEHRQQLLAAAAKTAAVTLNITAAPYGNAGTLQGTLTKKANALVIEIAAAADDADRTKLLKWSGDGDVTVESAQVDGMDVTFDVKNQANSAKATIKFIQ